MRHACMGVCIYACVYILSMYANQVSTLLSCYIILTMSLNKYGWDIVNMTHTAITLNGHIDHQFCVCAKTQKTATATSYVIAIYVL